MSRGFDGNPKGDMNSARRKKDRRAAIAQAQREKRRRLKATERKHAGGFLKHAISIATKIARESGWKVLVEKSAGHGSKALLRWNDAVVQLDPVDISVRFNLGDKQGTGAASTIRVQAGRKLIRTCPELLLQSGDGHEFAAWLTESLAAAAKRSASNAG